MKNSNPRKKYTTEKSVRLDGLLAAARDYKFSYSPKAINLKKDINEIKSLTENTCLFPTSYLNNDESCNECKINEHCCCSLKKFKTKNKNETRRK